MKPALQYFSQALHGPDDLAEGGTPGQLPPSALPIASGKFWFLYINHLIHAT